MQTKPAKIRPAQLLWLFIPLVAATGIDLAPSATSAIVGRSGWISVLLGAAAWSPFLFLHLQLGEYARGRTIAGLAEAVLGRWPGKLIGLTIALFFLHLTSLVIWEATAFVSVTLIPDTPPPVVLGVAILLLAWAVSQGVEVLARGAEFYVPVALFVFFLFILILSGIEMDVRNLLPIPDAPVRALIAGMQVPLALFAETAVLGALWPILPAPREIARSVWLGYLAIVLVLVLDVTATVAVFGPRLAAIFRFPFLQVTEMISLFEFIERLDAFHAAIWFGGIVLKASVILLASLFLWRDVFGLADYRSLAFPAGALLFPVTLSVVRGTADFERFVELALPYFLLANALLPTVIFLACRLRLARPRARAERGAGS